MDWSKFFREELKPISAYKPGLRPEQIATISGAEVIRKLSSNESPFGPFPSAVKAMNDAIENLNRYCDGSSQLIREAISDHYNIQIDNIFMGNGSNELLDTIAQTCINSGDEVITCFPSFVVYLSMTQLNAGTFVSVPLKADGSFDLDAILQKITKRTKLVMLCNPNNPTGNVVSKEEFDSFMQNIPDHVMLVVDEAYIEFVDDGATGNSLDYFDGKRPFIILRTFSKIYAMAGIRCGYGFAPKEVVEAINKVREPFNVNSLAQAGAIAAIQDVQELERRRAYNAKERAKITNALSEMSFQYYPTQTNFVYINFNDGEKVFNTFLQKGIIPRQFSNAMRITFGTSEDNDVLIDTLFNIDKEN